MLNDKSGKIKHLLGKKPSITSAEGIVKVGGAANKSNTSFDITMSNMGAGPYASETGLEE